MVVSPKIDLLLLSIMHDPSLRNQSISSALDNRGTDFCFCFCISWLISVNCGLNFTSTYIFEIVFRIFSPALSQHTLQARTLSSSDQCYVVADVFHPRRLQHTSVAARLKPFSVIYIRPKFTLRTLFNAYLRFIISLYNTL